MKIKSMNDLLLDLVKDLYSAESQLLKSLGKMAKKATNPELKRGFEEHIEQTEGQRERLEQIAEILGTTPRGKKCVAMEALIEEAKELMDEVTEPELLDAGLIIASQKAEHYEIASYGSAATMAQILGQEEVLNLLLETLQEEKTMDERLTELAKSGVNQEAASVEVEAEPEAAPQAKGGKKK